MKPYALFWFLFVLSFSPPTHAFSNKTCISSNSCSSDSFCHQPLPSYNGLCLPCWACCSFPESFGQCPHKCQCSDYCYYHSDCGSGRYCNRDLRTCFQCYNCNGDNDCSEYCTNDLPISPDIAFYQRYAYDNVLNIDYNNAIGSDVGVSDTQVTQWLSTFSNDKSYNNYVYNRLLPDLRYGATDILSFAENLASIHHYDPLCPRNGPLSLQGCPCAPSQSDIAPLKCPIGYRCSSRAYYGVSSSLYVDPLAHVLKAICIPCERGEYCPQGTYLDKEEYQDMQKIKCPEGFYCPSPAVKTRCNNGTFCPKGLSSPFTCDFNQLLRTTLSIPSKEDYVFERLTRYRDPIEGNICPINATAPSSKCPAGWYCPNPANQTICPAGYFCKTQTVAPFKCPSLSVCPTGSSVPDIVWTPYLFTFLFILLIFILSAIPKFYGLITQKCCHRNIVISVDKPYSPLPHHEVIHHIDDNVIPKVLSNFGIRASNQSTQKNGFVKPLEFIALYDVSARVSPSKDPWLWPNTAKFQPQKLNAIIGGSGCGKSTFLDLLRGNITSGYLSGRVEVKQQGEDKVVLDLTKMENLREWNNFNKMKQLRGYVPQDDILFPDLTVEENLTYSARLKSSMSRKAIKKVVQYTIDKLGMSHVKDKLVGSVEKRGISGGQRKRVNIGYEVVNMPSLLIMDEPTSGLDATGCQSLMDFCKQLTKEMDITIIAVIHQPRYTSFILFDHIILLCKYGTVFEGHPASSMMYFIQGLGIEFDKNENPADIMMDILSGKKLLSQQSLIDTWRSKGGKWVEDCLETYPMLPFVLNESITYDDTTQTCLTQLCPEDTLNTQYLFELFTNLGIKTSESACREFIDRYGSFNALNAKEFKRIFHETCSKASCRKQFGNVVERIELFTKTPMGIMQTFSQAQITKHITLAYHFIRNLMKRVGKTHQYFTMDPPETLVNEILICSMTCKALQSFIQQDGGAIGKELSTETKKEPNIFSRIYNIVVRKLLTMWRSPWPIQLLIPIIAALIVGNIQGADYDLPGFPSNVVFAMVTLGVLSIITHVRTFSLDKVIIRRETDAKISILPYYIAYNLTDLVWMTAIPMVFSIPYYYLVLPRLSFMEFYSVGLLVCWWCSGAAYAISSLPLALPWANLISVFISVIAGAFLQGLNPTIAESRGRFQGGLIHISFNRWAMEILTIKEYLHFDVVQSNTVWLTMDKIGMCGLKNDLFASSDVYDNAVKAYQLMNTKVDQKCLPYVRHAYAWLFGYGAIFRVLAIIVLFFNSHPIMLRFQWKVTEVTKQLYHSYKKAIKM